MKTSEKTKIVFMGGNLIGCTCLRYLLRLKDTKVTLVVGCYHDNGSIVDPKVWNASLARLALNKGLHFVQPKSPRNLQFINDIQHMNRPDIIVTAGYDKILDPTILNIARIGTINIHFAPLPKHRGYFPVIWSLLEDQTAGVTLHWVDNQVNAGDIIAQQTIPISREDTAFSLYSKLTKSGMKLFKKYFPLLIKGAAPRIPQNEQEATYHAAGYPYQRIIDWHKSNETINRFIRALTFPGFESARTFYNDMEISILEPVECLPNTNGDAHYEAGTILDIMPEGILVKTGDGKILIKKIKINKSMPIDAYKLSKLFTIKIGDYFKSYENLNNEGRLNLIVP